VAAHNSAIIALLVEAGSKAGLGSFWWGLVSWRFFNSGLITHPFGQSVNVVFRFVAVQQEAGMAQDEPSSVTACSIGSGEAGYRLVEVMRLLVHVTAVEDVIAGPWLEFGEVGHSGYLTGITHPTISSSFLTMIE